MPGTTAAIGSPLRTPPMCCSADQLPSGWRQQEHNLVVGTPVEELEEQYDCHVGISCVLRNLGCVARIANAATWAAKRKT